MIRKEAFGNLPDGRTVMMYTIGNSAGEYVQILDFGAAIHGIYTLDRRGKPGNAVLNVSRAEELSGFSREAVTIGRVANRIFRGSYVQNGIRVQLECNYKGEHFIHGAGGNYAYRFFDVEEISEREICLHLSDQGEGGFGCAAEVEVRYRFDDSSTLSLQYSIIPERDTVFSPTNHACFNLNDGADAAGHSLWLNASEYAPRGISGMPEGEIRSVVNTPLDFRTARMIKAAVEEDKTGFFGQEPAKYDENILISGEGLRKAAVLYAPRTGRGMCLYTDMPSVVLFTPLQKEEGCGRPEYSAVCLECQFVSNAVNCPEYRQPFCRAGEIMRLQVIYAFYSV